MESDDSRCSNPNCQIVFPISWVNKTKSKAMNDGDKYFCSKVCWHEYYNIPMKGEME